MRKQDQCTEAHKRTDSRCEKRKEHFGQHKAKAQAGYLYWS